MTPHRITCALIVAAIGLVLVIAALMPEACFAQQISADRPGIGIDPDTVAQWTLQSEMGTDGQELRLGLAKGFEADVQRGGGDYAAGVKLALLEGTFKAALRVTYDRQLGAVAEVPANVAVASWFNLGLDAMLSRSSRVYAAEFNFQPTGRLTISPTVYDDGKPRAAIFAAWVPLDNLQFDVGYDQHKVSVGMSTAFNFKDRPNVR